MDIYEARNLVYRKNIPELRNVLTSNIEQLYVILAIRLVGHYKDLESIPLLISKLSEGCPIKVRLAAAEELSGIGSASVEPLLVVLNKPKYRLGALWALKNIKDIRVVEPLAELLCTHHVSGAESSVVEGLVMNGSVSFPYVLNILNSPCPVEIKKYCLEILGKIGDLRAFDSLITNLENADPELRAYAADALGNIGDPRAYHYLIGALNDSFFRVRKYAARAAGRLRIKKSTPLLIRLLKSHDELEVREEAAWALGILGAPEAFEPLLSVLGEIHNASEAIADFGIEVLPILSKMWEKATYNLKVRIAEILGIMREKKAHELLLSFLTSEDEAGIRGILMESIASHRNLQDRELVSIIYEKERSVFVRKFCMTALGLIGGDESVGLLVKCLADEPEAVVRKEAVKSLEKIRGAIAFSAICSSFGADSDIEVRETCATALATFKEKKSFRIFSEVIKWKGAL